VGQAASAQVFREKVAPPFLTASTRSPADSTDLDRFRSAMRATAITAITAERVERPFENGQPKSPGDSTSRGIETLTLAGNRARTNARE